MKIQSQLICLFFVVVYLSQAAFGGRSVYTSRPEDSAAVYFTKDEFNIHADGVGDDSDALQEAIGRVASNGVLFIPEGTYRLSKTIYVWPGVRLIGYGETRPVFKLAENTDGYQRGDDKYMLYFAGGRGFGGRGGIGLPQDGSAGTFYGAISNIDIEIGPGNPAAIGIRFHVAQHSFISHMDFRLGTAKAGLKDIGNEVEDLHFYGGQYGIITRRSAPGWPILAIDCTFEDQTVAAVSLQEAGLTLVRPQFKNVPTAVTIVEGHPDELWLSDGRFENITGPALIISNENNARTQINLENIVCKDVPVLAKYRLSGKTITRDEPMYVVRRFSQGLHIGNWLGTIRSVRATIVIDEVSELPPAVKSDIAKLPAIATWMNVRSLGAKGDGQTDDTAVITKAIAEHKTIYFPIGVYNVSDTLTLKPDTVLVGFHPSATVINLPDNTSAFTGEGGPKPLIEAPKGGTNIINSIGIYTGTNNVRAVGIKWMAGAESMINDVRLHGGHGTNIGAGGRMMFGRAGNSNTWNTQNSSLWVTDGGGGTFKDIWTPSPYASSGMYISDTTTSGRLYAMSAEHHVTNEMIIKNVSNWKFFALQFEEERQEGPKALPLEIENCSNIQFANSFFYRVISCFVPFPHAVKISNSEDIRFRNVHCYSNSMVSFDSTIYDATAGIEIRDPEFAVLDVYQADIQPGTPAGAVVIADGAKVEKLADGFLNIAGAAVDSKGELYFTDSHELHIYKWSPELDKAVLVRDIPQQPRQLVFDKAGNLIVIAYSGNGTVLSFNPDVNDSEIITLSAEPAEFRPRKIPVFPLNRWMGNDEFMRDTIIQKPYHFVSPDGSIFIPAGNDFITGAMSWGVKMSDIVRAFGVAPAVEGHRFYVTNEAELKTWSFKVGPDGTLSEPRLFAEEGGQCVTVDAKGNVYIAAGQILVFDLAGKMIDTIEVPQRPTCLVFGGEDKKTLFITARSSLYSVRTNFAGR